MCEKTIWFIEERTHPIDQNQWQQDYQHVNANIHIITKEIVSDRFDVWRNEYSVNATRPKHINQQKYVRSMTEITQKV